MRFCRSVYSLSLAAVCTLALLGTFSLTGWSQDGVLTYRYNNQRTGLNSTESILTQSNVNVNTFGKLFELTVDGVVDAEPLYMHNVKIAGGTHNVVIVATEHDSVYAFDADSGTQYWETSLLLSGEMPSDDRGCNQVEPLIGVTSTPVISDGVLYAVAMSKTTSGTYYQRLHALNVYTGAEESNSPVVITGQYPGTGDNSSNGYVIFDPAQYKERSGLLLENGTIYLTWASHCDIRPYTGWIMAYSTSTLEQTSILNVTPNANEGAIWGSGGGLTADADGYIYFLDANGVFDSTQNSKGFPSSGDYGNAFMKLSTKSGLAVSNYFEMYDQAGENCCDIDLGSGGALLLPNLVDGTGKTWELAVGAGKDTNLYIVNRNDMGKYNSSSNNIYQELAGALPGGMWNSPVFTNDLLYFGPVGSPILAFKFKDAKLLTAVVAQSVHSFGFPGATLTASSDDGTNTVVWAVENTDPAVLHAYNPNLVELYNTTQAANGRDNFGVGNKYAAPTVANGKVYVPTTTGVGVFGLLSSPK